MFAVFQVPLTDVRPFLDEPTHRLVSPAWPISHLPDDPYKRPFVRGFGSARTRRLGGVEEWPAEDKYCDLSHALRFEGRVLKNEAGVLGPKARTYCAFRRLFWDGQLKAAGSVEGRVEIGFGMRTEPGSAGLGASSFGALLDALMGQRVRVAPLRKPLIGTAPVVAAQPLSGAGSALARSYLTASTASAGQAALVGHDWWLQAGTPLLIVEYVRDREVDALPARTVPVPLPGDTLPGIRIFLGRRTVQGRERPVWFFECDPVGHSRDALRRLRINVTRLNAALSSLRLLSDLQRTQRIVATTPAARANLQACLNRYLPFLYQKEYMGFAWTDFLRASLSLSEAFTPGSFATLRDLLPNPGRGLRSQLDQAVAAVAAGQPQALPPIEWDIFIAHAGTDTAIAEQLHAAIGTRARVFLDSKALLPGDEWDLALRDAQMRSFMTVALVSASADKAYYLRSEVAAAISLARLGQERHRVVPVYLEGAAGRTVAQPYGLNLKHGIDLPDVAALPQVADRIVETLERTRPASAASVVVGVNTPGLANRSG